MKNLSLTLLLFLLNACQIEPQTRTDNSYKPTAPRPAHTSPAQISPEDPSTMQVELSVHGYTTTLHNMDIVFLGQSIPYTYSAGKITNSRGYDWWVSKHFALKSDLPEEKVRLYLELLEMAYPHYVALFGMQPPNIERQRIAVVYGSSRERVREAMLDDGFLRGVHDTAGGETMYYNRAGYNFPSHRQHHQRYIVIHETMHAFQMALNGHSTWAPNWITEGLADSIAHHVYDPIQKKLTVMVFDRAPMNYIETGLAQYYGANKPSIEQINDDPTLKRGLNFFIIHYLLSSAERAQYFSYFMQQLMQANPHSAATLPTANKLLKHTFADWQAVEAGFADFVRQIKPSFHIVSGPWEQNGSAYWLRNTPDEQLSRLDIAPADGNSVSHPLMDFPVPPNSPLIHLTQAKQVAALIEFEHSQLQRGEIGLALPVKLSQANQQYRLTFMGEEQPQDDQLLKLLIINADRLVIRSDNLAQYTELNNQQVAFTPELKQALAHSKQLAITVDINHPNQLAINLVAMAADKRVTQSLTVPLPASLAAQLSARRISLLSKNNNHKISPYFAADESAPKAARAATNPWSFADHAKLTRLFVSCQQAAEQLPNCNKELGILMAQLSEVQKHDAVSQALNALFTRYKARLGDQGLEALSGINSQIYYHQNDAFLRVANPSEHELRLVAEVTYADGEAQALHRQHISQTVPPGISNIALSATKDTHNIGLKQTLNWQGLTHTSDTQVQARPFNGVQLNLVQRQIDKDNWLFEAALSGPYSGATTGELSFAALPTNGPAQINVQQQAVDIAPYQQQTYSFELAAGKQPLLIEVTALLDVDGEPIKLVKHLSL